MKYLSLLIALGLVACDLPPQSSDQVQRDQQERILKEGTAQIGMPGIKNFREKKLMKEILELRDQENFSTYTYLFAEQTGQIIFYCNSIGYGLPYAAQFTNPAKLEETIHGLTSIPQADPNGLFSPAAAEGTWVMCKDPEGDEVKPVYLEPRIIVSPFKRHTDAETVPTKKN